MKSSLGLDRVQRTLDAIVRGERDYEIARLVVPFFYYLVFFTIFTRLEGLNYIIATGGEGFAARWPLFFLAHADFASTVTFVFVTGVCTALCAAAFPASRIARIAGFFGILFFHAYGSSFGGPNHQFDYFLWIALIFIFLPRFSKEHDAEAQQRYSLVFWTAQAYLLLTYSMAGFLKVTYGLINFFQGRASMFSPDAGALHVATQLLAMHENVPLARAVLEHPYLSYPSFLAVLYLQFFAIVVAFRPHLHRLWGVGLVLFHLGTFLTMRAVFTAPAVLVMMFLLSSPYAPRFDWKETLRLLPLVPGIRGVYASMRFARLRQSSAADSS